MRLRFWRKKKQVEEHDTEVSERVLEARRERIRSEQRLREALPLRDLLAEMRERNHVSGYLDEVATRKLRRRLEGGGT